MEQLKLNTILNREESEEKLKEICWDLFTQKEMIFSINNYKEYSFSTLAILTV